MKSVWLDFKEFINYFCNNLTFCFPNTFLLDAFLYVLHMNKSLKYLDNGNGCFVYSIIFNWAG